MSEFVRELLPWEEEKPYAKYFHAPLAAPNPDIMQVLAKGPMDPNDALSPDAMSDLLKPGYSKVETGYCLLPNGAGYVAMNNKFPGCTVEMMTWWFAWHPLEPLRYSLWDHKSHHSIAIGDVDRKKILNPDVPLVEKTRGVTHWVVEDTGGGMDDILIHFMSPKAMGLDTKWFADGSVDAVYGGWAEMQPRASGQRGFAIMLHACRSTPEGIEFRSRFWVGYKFLAGRPVCMLPPGAALPLEAPMGLAYHNVEEYSNLAAILPQIYEEMAGTVQ